MHSFPLDILDKYNEYVTELSQFKKEFMFFQDRISKEETLGKSWK